MELVDKAADVLHGLHEAMIKAEPLIDATQQLVEATTMLVRDTRGLVGKAGGTLGRCDAILDKGPALADQLGELMRAQTALAQAKAARLG